VLGDLVGDLAPIQSLVSGDDSHGIYDGFVFGTSIEKLIRPVEGSENLGVLLGGTESPVIPEIISNRRWQRIASEFAATDALLLLVAAHGPLLKDLVSQLDGVVIVGELPLETIPNAVLLARIPYPTSASTPTQSVPAEEMGPRRRATGIALAAGALVVLIAALVMLRPAALRRGAIPRAADTVIIPDTVARDSARRPRPAVALPANPADSATAAAYAVEILAANTAEGANFELQRHGAMMPAATISVVPIGDTEAIWYKVFAGAFADSAQAERLLASLRRRHVVPDSSGAVVRAPLALRVDSVPAEGAILSKSREKVQGFAARGLAVYALMQSDGSARLYAGAFESPAQSSLAATALRVAGVTPVLEYRTGRAQ